MGPASAQKRVALHKQAIPSVAKWMARRQTAFLAFSFLDRRISDLASKRCGVLRRRKLLRPEKQLAVAGRDASIAA